MNPIADRRRPSVPREREFLPAISNTPEKSGWVDRSMGMRRASDDPAYLAGYDEYLNCVLDHITANGIGSRQ